MGVARWLMMLWSMAVFLEVEIELSRKSSELLRPDLRKTSAPKRKTTTDISPST
jgi:hypothetical protein